MRFRVRKTAHVLERVGLAMAGAACGMFVGAYVGTSIPGLDHAGLPAADDAARCRRLLSRHRRAAAALFCRSRARSMPRNSLSAVGTFLDDTHRLHLGRHHHAAPRAAHRMEHRSADRLDRRRRDADRGGREGRVQEEVTPPKTPPRSSSRVSTRHGSASSC